MVAAKLTVFGPPVTFRVSAPLAPIVSEGNWTAIWLLRASVELPLTTTLLAKVITGNERWSSLLVSRFVPVVSE